MGENPVTVSLHVGEILAILGVGYKIFRKLSVIIDAFENFPPHRHVNGKILYPRDFSPGRIEVESATKTT